MTDSDYLKCECQGCRGHLEFPAAAAGASVECPHCGQQTILVAPGSHSGKAAASKKFLILCVTIVLLVAIAGIIFTIVHQRRTGQLEAQAVARPLEIHKTSEAHAVADDPLARAGWMVSKIVLEKTPGSTIVHSVGTLTNETDRRRFGVKIQLDLFNSSDQKIGGAMDYQPIIEARAEWKFHALVVNAGAVTAKVAAVEESP